MVLDPYGFTKYGIGSVWTHIIWDCICTRTSHMVLDMYRYKSYVILSVKLQVILYWIHTIELGSKKLDWDIPCGKILSLLRIIYFPSYLSATNIRSLAVLQVKLLLYYEYLTVCQNHL